LSSSQRQQQQQQQQQQQEEDEQVVDEESSSSPQSDKESSSHQQQPLQSRKNSNSSNNNDTSEVDDGGDQEVPWKPQATQSTCEFTHTITNYSQKRDSGCKKAEYSATTIDEFGNRWRLIVYVNGNGRASNHHLSLFLQVCARLTSI
jgi:hypothetical protein